MSQPHVAARLPCPVEVTAGKIYWWCACGLSKNQPFCDGSHKGSEFSPVEFRATRNKIVFFCACKHSATSPVCDGAHAAMNS